MKYAAKGAKGFTFIEALFAVAIFVIVAGASFSLLGVAQKRYATDSQVLNAFQQQRLGMDQMIKDFAVAGYPPQNQFSYSPNTGACTPIAWSPGYFGTCPSGSVASVATCQVGVTCTTPSSYDLILETNADQESGDTEVQWIHYELDGTTLYRGAVNRTRGWRGGVGNPVTATAEPGVMMPYVQNVMNNGSATEIAAINAVYPGTFPGGAPVPVFSYSCGVPGGSTVPCSNAANTTPANIMSVDIMLIVQAAQPDAQTGQLRVSMMHGRGKLLNFSQ